MTHCNPEAREPPPLTGNDIALALFGVMHMQAWLKEQPKCSYVRDEMRKAKALNAKLSRILDALYPWRNGELEDIPLDAGGEDVYGPLRAEPSP